MVKIAKPSETWESKKGSYCKRKKPILPAWGWREKLHHGYFLGGLTIRKNSMKPTHPHICPTRRKLFMHEFFFKFWWTICVVSQIGSVETVWRGHYPILHGRQGFWKVLPCWKTLPYFAWQARVLKSIANLMATHIFHVHAVHLVTSLENLCL